MFDEGSLQRLSQEIAPSDAKKQSIKERVMKRVSPVALTHAVESVVPCASTKLSLREKLLRMISSSSAETLSEVSSSVRLPVARAASLRETILSRLEQYSAPVFHGGLKWAAAFAVLLIIVRAMPFLFLAPSTQADLAVQLIPEGEGVSVYVGGVWQEVAQAQILTGPSMIQTGDAGATIILNDDGVLRLEPNTTLKLHSTEDNPSGARAPGPTATLIRGEFWALGMLPPFIDALSIEVPGGLVSINTGSVGMTVDGDRSSVNVYDRGATVTNGTQTVFLVAGEGVKTSQNSGLPIVTLPESAFIQPWVAINLQQDAQHRSEISKLQEERRAKAAGILPTSILYPAKRIAEEVDVLFTLTTGGRAEKRLEQANTRLKEAIALMKEGEGTAASAPLAEYKSSLIAMASSTDDNLVQHVIKRQIADASVGVGTEGESAAANIELLKQAVSDVSDAIPNADLKPEDIEGYILVDRLAHINQTISKDTEAAALSYADVQPYLQKLLAENSGVNPLLKKEAVSLLVSTSNLVSEASKESSGEKEVLSTIQSDITKYIPAEHEKILLSEEELNASVDAMLQRILLFRHPRSRYNQLLAEMEAIRNDDNRGTLLRRLKAALPEGLGEYVNTEIHELKDELQAE